jgi:hypothetical protein
MADNTPILPTNTLRMLWVWIVKLEINIVMPKIARNSVTIRITSFCELVRILD